MQDYLNAYETTGRPPVPCPPEPTAAHARAALGLPPIFQPRVIDPDIDPPNVNGHTVAPNGPAQTAPIIAGPIPDKHIFRPFPVAEDGQFLAKTVTHYSITMQPEFAGYSFEV